MQAGVAEVRAMRPGDADEINRLLINCLDEYYRPEMPLFFLDQWPRGSFVAYDCLGNLAGYIAGVLLPERRASVSLLCVRPDLRNLGIGTALLRNFINSAFSDNVRMIQLEVRTDNPGAIRLYARLGFVATETIPGYYQDGGSALRMCSRVHVMNRVLFCLMLWNRSK